MEIGTIGAAIGTPRPAEARGLSAMKSEDFLRILVTEMQNQDPFEPAKTADMISQVSQIRSIELSGKLTDTLDLLTRQQRIDGGSQLIGKYVQALTTAPDGSQMLQEGVVTGIRFGANGLVLLELDSGEVVSATDVIRVTTVDEAEKQLSETDDSDDETT